MNIETILNESVIAAIKELYGQEIAAEKVQLQKPVRSLKEISHLWCSPSCRCQKRPEETAQEIGEKIAATQPLVAGFNVIKGF